jgi:hypothetical protein
MAPGERYERDGILVVRAVIPELGLAVTYYDETDWLFLAASTGTGNCSWIEDPVGRLTRLVWLGYWGTNNGAFQGINYIDDMFVQYGTRARSRVEIGNAPVWEDCSRREIQPVTTWGATGEDITVTLNYGGSFSDGNQAYLFVVRDINGLAYTSPGFPITLGAATPTRGGKKKPKPDPPSQGDGIGFGGWFGDAEPLDPGSELLAAFDVVGRSMPLDRRPAAGIYFLRINTPNGNETRKVLVR